MSLKLSRCDRCEEIYLTSDIKTYCVSCRIYIMNLIRRRRFNKHYPRTNGNRAIEHHYEHLKSYEIKILQREGVKIYD